MTDLVSHTHNNQMRKNNTPRRLTTRPPPEPQSAKELTPKVCIMNLPLDIQRYELVTLFKDIGTVVDTFIPTHFESRRGAFGFVLFKTVQEAATAVLLFNETIHFGRTIHVAFAQPKRWTQESSQGKAEDCCCNCHKKPAGGKFQQTSDGWTDLTRNQQAQLSRKRKERGLSISRSFAFNISAEERTDSNTASRRKPAQGKIRQLPEQKSECKREKQEKVAQKTGEKTGEKRKENAKVNGKEEGLGLLAISTDISKSELSEDYYSYEAKPFADFCLKKETM